MKKFCSIAIVLLSFQTAALAQVFEFQYHGVTVGEEEKVTIAAETDMFGELACETNPSDDPTNGLILVGADGATVSGTAHMEILEHTFKAKTVQWCMGGACVPMKDVTELDKEFEGAIVLTQFDAYTIRQEGYLLAKLTVTVGSQTSTIYIEFTNGQTSGINSINSVENRADVYDLNGRLLMRQADTSARQQLSTGVYVVKDGPSVRKVVVK